MTIRIKPLVWEDADEGMCTKWRAAALGGSYELVSFKGEEGFAVNFYWGRPLSYWFIQGEPDEWGYPTGPKMFPDLEAAKAAAQADFEARALSAINTTDAMQARVKVLEDALRWYHDQMCEGFCKDLRHDSTYTPEMDDVCAGCKARAALEGEK